MNKYAFFQVLSFFLSQASLCPDFVSWLTGLAVLQSDIKIPKSFCCQAASPGPALIARKETRLRTKD